MRPPPLHGNGGGRMKILTVILAAIAAVIVVLTARRKRTERPATDASATAETEGLTDALADLAIREFGPLPHS